MFKRIGWDRYVKEAAKGVYLILLGQGIKWEVRYLPHSDPNDNVDVLWAKGYDPSVCCSIHDLYSDAETQAQRYLREGYELQDYEHASVINASRKVRLVADRDPCGPEDLFTVDTSD